MKQADEARRRRLTPWFGKQVEPCRDDPHAVLPDLGERWPLELSAFLPHRTCRSWWRTQIALASVAAMSRDVWCRSLTAQAPMSGISAQGSTWTSGLNWAFRSVFLGHDR